MNWKATVSVIGLLAFCFFIGCEEDNKPNKNDDGGIQCGNGIVEYSEKCDGTELSPFYKTCNAFNNKIKWEAGGTPGCDDQCQLMQGTCKPLSCGNGEIDEGEECDGKLLAQIDNPCEPLDKKVTDWEPNGLPGCDPSTCKLTPGTCKSKLCGNDRIDDGEECDGNAFKDSKTPQCSDKPGNWDPSILPTCESDCSAINYDACVEFECGNGIIEGDEVCDGNTFKDSMDPKCSDKPGNWDPSILPTCESDCSAINYGVCVEFECGNGIRQGTEQCDGTDFGLAPGEHVCSPLDKDMAWHDFGKPSCNPDCTLAQGSCKQVVCDGKPCPAEYPMCGLREGKLTCVICQEGTEKCDPDSDGSGFLLCSPDDASGYDWRKDDCGTDFMCVPRFGSYSPLDTVPPIGYLSGECVSKPSTCTGTYEGPDGEDDTVECDGALLPADVSCASTLQGSPIFKFIEGDGKVKCSDRCTLDPTDCELENNPSAEPIEP